jgi:S-adenosylmethionine decarboxylase
VRGDVSSSEFLKVFLAELASCVEMHILAGPLIAEGHPDNPGMTGFVVVDYSHISIHTFTAHDEALIDIFSCKPYNKDAVRGLLRARCSTEASVIREQEVHWGA